MTTFRSYAKINLHLQVLGKRPDGYHELRTIFQTVSLYDELEVELDGVRGAVELRLLEGSEVGAAELSVGEDNLIVRAARAYAERWPLDGARFGIRKRIPLGGGLGGGSSNAASVLLALRELTGRPSSVGELRPLARALGADVPYFLLGGTALGFGRGDELVPLPDLEETRLLLATPALHVSTAEAFGELREEDLSTGLEPRFVDLLAHPRAATWDDLAGTNDLQRPVFARFPELRKVCDNLAATGGMGVRLSGTGATLFCRLPSEFGRNLYQSEVGFSLLRDVRTVSRRQLARTFKIEGQAAYGDHGS